jgi:hypothetical protein
MARENIFVLSEENIFVLSEVKMGHQVATGDK